jgi:hypothetical protein
MTKIALDANALAALAATESGVVAVTDAAGNIVGFYAPVKQEYAADYAAAAAHFYPDKDKPRPGGPWFTSEQMAEHLKSLEKP